MSSVYNAQGKIPQPTVGAGTQVQIQSSTNAAPIVVTFQTPHGFSDQDSIEIEGHTGNLAANGQWQATVVNSTQVSLNGSTGTGAGGATGYATDYAINPLITIPSDGDLASGSSINPAIEGNNNAIPFLYRRSGRYRLYNLLSVDFGGGSNYANITTTSTSYNAVSGLTSLLGYNNASLPAVATQTGDVLEYYLSLEAAQVSLSGSSNVNIGFSVNGGAYVVSLNAPAQIQNQSGSIAGNVTPFTLIGTIITSGFNKFDFAVMVANTSGSATYVTQFSYLGHLIVKQWRPN